MTHFIVFLRIPALILGVITGDYVGDFNDAPLNQTKLVAANSPANAPITGVLRGFLTTLSNSGQVMQKYIECYESSHKNKAFHRTYSGTTWSEWKEY